MTVWTDNATRFASRADDCIDAARHAGVREAIGHLRDGDPEKAHDAVQRAFRKQVRMAGLELVVVTS